MRVPVKANQAVDVQQSKSQQGVSGVLEPCAVLTVNNIIIKNNKNNNNYKASLSK